MQENIINFSGKYCKYPAFFAVKAAPAQRQDRDLQGKYGVLRMNTEGYGVVRRNPISHFCCRCSFCFRCCGLKLPPPYISVILRISPYKPSIRSFGPVRQVRRVRQKNLLLRHKGKAEAQVIVAIAGFVVVPAR